MEIANGLHIPVVCDSVLSPAIYYNDQLTGIYFQTGDDQFGRITFYHLDAIRVCRGEYLPYAVDREGQEGTLWVYKVDHSTWQRERYAYEKEHYENAYEFGGNVEEMVTDFSHYLFQFHDQFVEAIAKGFWFEKETGSLFGKELQPGHPMLPLTQANVERFTAYTITCQARINTKSIDELVWGAQYCPQKLVEFALELDGDASVSKTLILTYSNGRLISRLQDYFGKPIVELDGVATLESVRPYLEQYIEAVIQRRKAMGK
jgi:hypothetical protein